MRRPPDAAPAPSSPPASPVLGEVFPLVTGRVGAAAGALGTHTLRCDERCGVRRGGFAAISGVAEVVGDVAGVTGESEETVTTGR